MNDYTGRTYSMCLNVEGFMRNNRYPKGYDIFQHDDGKDMPPEEALAFLTMEKAKGHKVIPFSASCGNPCSGDGCPGFDYSGSGCGGRRAISRGADKE